MGAFPRNTTAVQGIPIGRLNDISIRLSILEAKNMGGLGNMSWYQDEVLTFSDGVHYTLAHDPTSVLLLFQNGQKLINGTDFTNSGASITMTSTMLSTDIITATYAVAVTSVWYQDETLTYTDGKHYTLAHTPLAIVFLFLNGQLVVAGLDYTRIGTAITMTNTLSATDALTTTYQ
jgi:TATA-box binding protein (TBP) (component of TFIID and TFIIIB)